MKRKFYLLLCLLLVMFIMTGCYSSDMNVKIGMSGNVDVDGHIVATDEALSGLFGDESGKDTKAIIKEQIDVLNNFYKENKTDAKVAAIEAESIKDSKGTNMNGIKYTLKFDSIDQMLSSRLFSSINGIFPISSYESSGAPITLTRTNSMFGTSYTAKGTLGILGQYGTQIAGDATNKLENAQAKITFELPSLFIKSNATEKASFGKRLTWIVTSKGDTELSFSVFVPNIALVIAAIIILLLLVIIFILLGKLKKVNPIALDVPDEEADNESLFEEPENELNFEETEAEPSDSNNEEAIMPDQEEAADETEKIDSDADQETTDEI